MHKEGTLEKKDKIPVSRVSEPDSTYMTTRL